MTNKVQVLRSSGNAAPGSLLAGELAWAEGSGGTAVGGALFIGTVAGGVRTVVTKAQTDKIDGIDATIDSRADARIEAASVFDLSDIHTTTPSDGQVLTWDDANNRAAFAASGSGVTTFIALNDTPANYTDKGGFVVRVNSAANALEFVETIDAGTF